MNAPSITKPPYVSLFREIGPIQVWIVDGSYVRAKIDPNFTDFAEHQHSPYVPADQFWIDKDTDPSDRGYFLDNVLVQHRLMSQGVSYEKALAAGDKVEHAERQRANPQAVYEGHNKGTAGPVLLALWGETDNLLMVYVVDGAMVRLRFDENYVEGGHDLVYPYIPKDEVWIEQAIYDDPDERLFDLLHELYERRMMQQGMPYVKAHDAALKIEHETRNHPELLKDALAHCGWHSI